MKKPIEFRIFLANMKLTPYSRLTRDQARKHDSHLRRYNNNVTGAQ